MEKRCEHRDPKPTSGTAGQECSDCGATRTWSRSADGGQWTGWGRWLSEKEILDLVEFVTRQAVRRVLARETQGATSGNLTPIENPFEKVARREIQNRKSDPVVTPIEGEVPDPDRDDQGGVGKYLCCHCSKTLIGQETTECADCAARIDENARRRLGEWGEAEDASRRS